MTDAPFTPPVDEAEDPEYAANLRRATLASTVGSALEYYDFALYGLASALIFSKLFFTNLDPAIALVASFATFGVGFVARPLGGLFFGTIGDKLGRKWVLIVTILLMGGSSTLVGALPTYDDHRHLGAHPAGLPPVVPGLRSGRRAGRIDGADGRVRPDQAARVLRRVAVHRHPGRHPAGRHGVRLSRHHPARTCCSAGCGGSRSWPRSC